MVDIKTVEYGVELIIEDGTRYILNDVLVSLEWEEHIDELSQRANITVRNVVIGNTWLMALAKINCIIQIYGKWNGGTKTLLFEGTIWEWKYASSTQKELDITAYDYLIRLQQSKDFKFYSPGLTTQHIIGDICNDWGVPLAYNWEQSITHEKKVFSAERISDMIIGLLEEVTKRTGEKYTICFRDGQVQVTGLGTNTTVYKFDTENTISTNNKLTINKLVTQVVVMGKEDSNKKRPVEDTVPQEIPEPPPRGFGVLREIVLRNEDMSLADARAEAQTILDERGKPEETIQITVPDLPFIRKGDKIEVAAGNLIGYFYVEGVSHNATSRQMALTLLRS